MNELTSFSFTVKNLYDDAADSLAVLADYLSNGIKTVSVGKKVVLKGRAITTAQPFILMFLVYDAVI